MTNRELLSAALIQIVRIHDDLDQSTEVCPHCQLNKRLHHEEYKAAITLSGLINKLDKLISSHGYNDTWLDRENKEEE